MKIDYVRRNYIHQKVKELIRDFELYSNIGWIFTEERCYKEAKQIKRLLTDLEYISTLDEDIEFIRDISYRMDNACIKFVGKSFKEVCETPYNYGSLESNNEKIESKTEKIGEDNMKIQKKEVMSFEEFLENKDETYVSSVLCLDEEKIKNLKEEYGVSLSKTYTLDSEVILLHPKSIEFNYCGDNIIVPLDFIKNVEVTIKY